MLKEERNMALPKYSDFYKPIMKLLLNNTTCSTKEIKEFCIRELELSNEDIKETFENGNFVLPNRIGWALTYLKKAQLINSEKRSYYSLTEEGMRVAQKDLELISTEYLQKYENFQQFINGYSGSKEVCEKNSQESPVEAINSAMKKVDEALIDELMAQVIKMNPYEFEVLVMKLLEKMGYGAAERNIVTKKSNDEGIDGVVFEDRLGFQQIYIQAKKWDVGQSVGRPEIQKFLGAIAGQGGTKGLFITTSDFSSGAKEYVKKQLNQKIILINGRQLMQYMIKYNIGVSVESIYEIKKVDYDFFSNEI